MLPGVGIHIWDRITGNLLHHIGTSVSGQVTSIAWSNDPTTLMFATGGYDGMVSIWAPLTDKQKEQAAARPGEERAKSEDGSEGSSSE